MPLDLKPFEKLIEEGYINKQSYDNLIILNYTDKCVYDKKWNWHTIYSRGLILDSKTGDVLARPLSKFFNLSEDESTMLRNLPKEPYIITEKIDGSLGISFWHNNKLRIATRGSFESEQAKEAVKILYSGKYDIKSMEESLDRTITMCLEILYPENRIVVNYKGRRELVLIAAFDRHTWEELPRNSVEAMARRYGFSYVKAIDMTIEEAIEMQKTLPPDQEGFVVHWPHNGLRVKIKGQEYSRRHKLLSQLSPISVWEVMKDGSVPETYKKEFPDDILSTVLEIENKLIAKYKVIKTEIEEEMSRVPYKISGREDKENRKNVGLWIKEHEKTLKHASVIFPYLFNKPEDVDKYIMSQIRPDANVLE